MTAFQKILYGQQMEGLHGNGRAVVRYKDKLNPSIKSLQLDVTSWERHCLDAFAWCKISGCREMV